MTPEQIAALEERIFSTIHAHLKSLDTMKALEVYNIQLRAEVERLRSVVKSAEWSCGYDGMDCPWCNGTCDVAGAPRHNDDCPTFTHEGAVR